MGCPREKTYDPSHEIMSEQSALTFESPFDRGILENIDDYYSTFYGSAVLGDSLEELMKLPTGSVNAVVTSPPYALHFKKEYGNVNKCDYINWFMPFAEEIKRILAEDGSFILNLGGSYNRVVPLDNFMIYKDIIRLDRPD